MKEIFSTVVSLLFIGWLVNQSYRKFILKKPLGMFKHNVIKLWEIQEVGRTRLYSFWKDIFPVFIFHMSASYYFPDFERTLIYFSTAVLTSIVLIEPIRLFRYKYPRQIAWIARVSLLIILGLIGLSVKEFVSVIA